MKGQYRVVFEVMLFAIGVAITSFVLVSFQDLQDRTDEASVRSQLNTVLNSVLNGIAKASLTSNAIVRVEIPPTISGQAYKIFVQANKNLTALVLKDTTVNVSREIFNIDEPNNRVAGEVASGAGTVEITYDGSRIIVQRG